MSSKKKTFSDSKKKCVTKKDVVRIVNGISEKKRLLVSVTAGEFDYDGRREYLTTIAQGSNEGERIGRMVKPVAFVARLKIYQPTVNGQANNSAWTIFLVQDTQQVGDTPAAVSEIISDVGTVRAPMGLININNKGRFKILKRWQGILNATTEGSAKYLNIYYRFHKDFNMRYNGTAATDIEANGVMLVLLSDKSGASDACYVTGVMRLWYTDP